MRGLLLLPLVAGLAACAQTPAETAAAAQAQQAAQTGLEKELAGLTPEKPISCIPFVRPSTHTSAYGSTLLYRANRNLVYRNDTAGGCEAVARGDILVSVEHQGRPCQGDIARTVDPLSHMTTGSCALGDFIPYRRQ